jgi:hypothetical protein
VPIIKDKDKDVCDSDNYRAISLSSNIAKWFEMCILINLRNYLGTNELQFGFKKGLGCRDAIFVVKSVVEYFNKYGSTVNIATLDISKAFDKVNIKCLMSKLIKKKIPICYVDILLYWYSHSTSCVKWKDSLSDEFRINAGVRQGGVLSPLLFAVYIDEVVDNLVSNGVGCRINNIFVGCVLYADDIVLLSVSLHALQSMINNVKRSLDNLDLMLNVGKCKVCRVGPKFKRCCCPIKIDNTCLMFVDTMDYLGVYIDSGYKLKFNDINNLSKFYKSVNCIFAKFKGKVCESVLLFLIDKYCKSHLMYGYVWMYG